MNPKDHWREKFITFLLLRLKQVIGVFRERT